MVGKVPLTAAGAPRHPRDWKYGSESKDERRQEVGVASNHQSAARIRLAIKSRETLVSKVQNLSKQRHQLAIECSNTEARGGYFTSKSMTLNLRISKASAFGVNEYEND